MQVIQFILQNTYPFITNPVGAIAVLIAAAAVYSPILLIFALIVRLLRR
jgi:hypothetical protein